jgi:hypothetical protein
LHTVALIFFAKFIWNWRFKENEMGREKINSWRALWRDILKETDQCIDLGGGGMIILN